MTTESNAVRKNTAAVLGIALLLRAVTAWIAMTRYAPVWLFTRGMEMSLLAKSLLAAQTMLNLATIALMMHVARRLFNERAAVLAGLVWACSPPLLWMPTIFWETSFSACMLMGLVALALHWSDRPAKWMWPLLGAYCGAIALMNPALLLSALAIT